MKKTGRKEDARSVVLKEGDKFESKRRGGEGEAIFSSREGRAGGGGNSPSKGGVKTSEEEVR